MHHPEPQRLHALDAVRGFALLLGVAFHAALSFMPGWPPGLWAMVDKDEDYRAELKAHADFITTNHPAKLRAEMRRSFPSN